MSNQETVEYRLTALDKKIDTIDEKFESIGNKIDSIRTEIISNRCVAPGSCALLKLQVDNTTKTLERINTRLDEHDSKVEKHESDLRSVKNWQRVAFYGLGVAGSAFVFFRDQIIFLLTSVF